MYPNNQTVSIRLWWQDGKSNIPISCIVIVSSSSYFQGVFGFGFDHCLTFSNFKGMHEKLSLTLIQQSMQSSSKVNIRRTVFAHKEH